MSNFRRITLFCLEKRLSKHKMTVFSKNLEGACPPGYADVIVTILFAIRIYSNSVHFLLRHCLCFNKLLRRLDQITSEFFRRPG